jgi:hypothetical protein
MQQFIDYTRRIRDICLSASDCSVQAVQELNDAHNVSSRMRRATLRDYNVTGVNCSSQILILNYLVDSHSPFGATTSLSLKHRPRYALCLYSEEHEVSRNIGGSFNELTVFT